MLKIKNFFGGNLMCLKEYLNKKDLIKYRSAILSRLWYSIKIIIPCSVIFIATAQPAYCYIDPGSGSMIWQLIVSAFIGMAFYFRKFIAGVFSKFKKNDKKQELSHEEK